MTTRNGSSFRYRLPLALGIAAAIPVLGAWAQDPKPDQDTPPAATAPEKKANQKPIEARAKARQAREAELKALAEQIREKREALEAEEARERAEAEADRARAEQKRARLRAEVATRQADLLLLDLRIEATKEALKSVWKKIAEVELQDKLRGDAGAADRDVASMNILRKQAETYEQQLREYVGKKVELAGQVDDLEREQDRARARANRPTATTRSVAESVDRLLGHLNEQGAIDARDHRRLNNAVGALEELIDLFREYNRGGDTEPVEVTPPDEEPN